MSMEKVEAIRRPDPSRRRRRWQQRRPAADHPLGIPGFVVYFENNMVIHTVAIG